jgi:hypothetical protein
VRNIVIMSGITLSLVLGTLAVFSALGLPKNTNHILIADTAPTRTIDLTTQWDTETVLKNPHKGWYHHYFDNGISKYLTRTDKDLDKFPGMDHLYLRVPWSLLEPQQGQINWKLLDDIVEKWKAKGYSFSFRITCKETSEPYATPEWVRVAGAKGQFVNNWGKETWQPDYGDRIFLQHLEAFHKAFAARYDGKPWVEYVDIGSYGDWGEGHNSPSGRGKWSLDILKKHIELHRRWYKNTRLFISEDIVTEGVLDGSGATLADYIIEQDISFRDDSILVGWYVRNHATTHSVRSPELFARVYNSRPTLLETQHYSSIKDQGRDGTWSGKDGTQKGGCLLEEAVKLTRATWLGYHGRADEYLRDNPSLVCRLANLVGYWYFPVQVQLPDRPLKRGRRYAVKITWRNRGVAPAYHRFTPYLKISGANGKATTANALHSDNRMWKPTGGKDSTINDVTETYWLDVPDHLRAGQTYQVSIRMQEEHSKGEFTRPVYLGMKAETKDAENFYALGTVQIE